MGRDLGTNQSLHGGQGLDAYPARKFKIRTLPIGWNPHGASASQYKKKKPVHGTNAAKAKCATRAKFRRVNERAIAALKGLPPQALSIASYGAIALGGYRNPFGTRSVFRAKRGSCFRRIGRGTLAVCLN